MEKYHRDVIVPAISSPDAAKKLIRKLRWVGLEDEARRLQHTMRFVFADRGILSDIPYHTD